MRGRWTFALAIAFVAAGAVRAADPDRKSTIDQAVDQYRSGLHLDLRTPTALESPGMPSASQTATAPLTTRESAGRFVALRLRPGDDLYQRLAHLAVGAPYRALAVVTCVGSLSKAAVRFADARDAASLTGPFEIVSLVGTIAPDGPHLHICLADKSGNCVGGHLKEGSIVYTTAEVVLVEATDLEFHRRTDAATGYPELAIEPRTAK